MTSYHHKLKKARSGILIVNGSDSVTIPLEFKAKTLEISLTTTVTELPSCAPIPRNEASGEVFRHGICISWNVEAECEIHWRAEK